MTWMPVGMRKRNRSRAGSRPGARSSRGEAMKSRAVGFTIAAIVVISLAIGIFWTVRTAPPSPRPWWSGRNPVIRAEVWEPGKDMATVAMRMPKSMFDTLIAFGLPARITVGDHHSIDVKTIWKELQRLPKGQKLKLEDSDGVLYIWIDTGDGAPSP